MRGRRRRRSDSLWNALLRAFGLVWLPIVLSWVAVGVLVTFVVGALALFGGVEISGSSVDWTAVAALATAVSALATVALGAGLVISASQIEEERRRRQRISGFFGNRTSAWISASTTISTSPAS